MLVNDKEALDRINSPSNLLNKIKALNSVKNSKNSLDIFKNKITIPNFTKAEEKQNEVDENKNNGAASEVETITIDKLINNSDSQIKLAAVHNKAVSVLNQAIDDLSVRLTEVKAEKLPSIITATSKVVESIRKEQIAAKQQQGDNSVHYHFYTPQQKSISDYEVIEVGASATS